MFEGLLVLIIGLGVAVMALVKRSSTLKRRLTVEQQKTHSAEQAATHNAEIARTIIARQRAATETIKEKVDESVENDFDDFYDSPNN